MDIRMPKMGGVEALKKIKKTKPEIPIIAQTAYTLRNEVKAIIDAGFDDYITKPIDTEELIKKIKSAVN
jgi:CheY-like chemotaxis protein